MKKHFNLKEITSSALSSSQASYSCKARLNREENAKVLGLSCAIVWEFNVYPIGKSLCTWKNGRKHSRETKPLEKQHTSRTFSAVRQLTQYSLLTNGAQIPMYGFFLSIQIIKLKFIIMFSRQLSHLVGHNSAVLCIKPKQERVRQGEIWEACKMCSEFSGGTFTVRLLYEDECFVQNQKKKKNATH